MGSKEEKQNRKILRQIYKTQEEQAKESHMPISKIHLKELFDYLDEKLEEEGCQHKLILTEAFLTKKGLSVETKIPWLNQYGGYCDCEVLANVEDEFEGII